MADSKDGYGTVNLDQHTWATYKYSSQSSEPRLAELWQQSSGDKPVATSIIPLALSPITRDKVAIVLLYN